MFDRQTQIRLLAQQYGVSEARATALLGEQEGYPMDLPTRAWKVDAANGVQPIPPVAFPFRITVPWSELCSDNEKEVGTLTMRGNRPVPRKVLTARYKAAKEAIRKRARAIVKDAQPTTEPLSIHVRVWLPPSRRNDAINFAKVVGDALETVIFENDNQLHRSLWERMGTDIDAPRAEIEINVLR